ncbi:signal recognition particle protein [Desulfurococcaceae archaeon AG1]|nr:signal recognition particle protein [Desulfurococcaceae archaeon AG1]
MKGLERIKEAVVRFVKGSDPYEQAVESFIKELQKTLIQADVNVKLVYELSNKIREHARSSEPPPGFSRRDWFIKIVYDNLAELFGGDRSPSIIPPKQPYVVLMVGVQGSGKTTTCAKISYLYKKQGYRPCMVAADTYRPGAYDQLAQLGEMIGVPVYGEPGSQDPVGIAMRGVEAMIKKGCNIIIVDTAGRHGYGSEQALLDEMKSIAEVIKPDEVMLVLDATIGQRAYDLAKRFHETVPIGSIVVTKLDGSARGGGALSAVAATGAVIKFIGTGEKIDEIEVFNPRRFTSRILGLGDIEGIIEKFRALEESKELEKRLSNAIATGRMTLIDVYVQLKSILKMGPLAKILQMIPGLSGLMIGDEEAKISEKKMRKWINIMDSMTYEELQNPKILDKSRIRRIAIGSGTSVEEVKELLSYYENLQRILKEAKRRRLPLLRGVKKADIEAE